MPTIQAGLACGEPNTISWEILKNHIKVFTACPDWVSVQGMRLLGAPLKGDPQVISGESGAVPMGLLFNIMTNPKLASLKEALALDRTSRVLLFSTEGDTDPQRYKDILWFGKNYD